MIRARAIALTALAAAAVVAGCGGSDDDGSSDRASAPAPSANAPKPKVRFTSPRDGTTVGSTVTARVALQSFKLAPRSVGRAPRPGEGHLHFEMDGGRFDRPRYSGPNGKLGKKLGVTGRYSPALAPVITYRHLPPGEHMLEVYLANNNHTNVGVEAEVEFRVR